MQTLWTIVTNAERPKYAQLIREIHMQDQLNKGKHAKDKQHKQRIYRFSSIGKVLPSIQETAIICV